MMLTTKRSSRRSWKFHNCRLAPTLKGKLMKSSSYGPPPWWPTVHHVPPIFDYIYTKFQCPAHKTFPQGAQNWQREPFLQHERSRLLEEALRDRRSPRGSYWADWQLHSSELSTFGHITQTKKQTNSLSSKASHAITAGSLVLPAEWGSVGLPLCQPAQL